MCMLGCPFVESATFDFYMEILSVLRQPWRLNHMDRYKSNESMLKAENICRPDTVSGISSVFNSELISKKVHVWRSGFAQQFMLEAPRSASGEHKHY